MTNSFHSTSQQLNNWIDDYLFMVVANFRSAYKESNSHRKRKMICLSKFAVREICTMMWQALLFRLCTCSHLEITSIWQSAEEREKTWNMHCLPQSSRSPASRAKKHIWELEIQWSLVSEFKTMRGVRSMTSIHTQPYAKHVGNRCAFPSSANISSSPVGINIFVDGGGAQQISFISCCM